MKRHTDQLRRSILDGLGAAVHVSDVRWQVRVRPVGPGGCGRPQRSSGRHRRQRRHDLGGPRRAGDRAGNVTFEVGDVQALPFADGEFDVCRAARLLEHLTDPARALSEMVRVTRPDGRVVLFDFDWDTLVIDHPDKATTRNVVLSYSDSIRNGWVGRQLPRLLRAQGLDVTSVDPVHVFVHYALAELFLGSHLAHIQESGLLSADEVRAWWQRLREADERGSLLIGFTAFVVVGRLG